ncbi:MAG TPA: AraC family transcriptional regulator [Candidatus Angelobacter sp.]|nr:AraC family transcriptional regulator [Candidatus Angelobacter sp.]
MRAINYHSRLAKVTSYLQDHPQEFVTLAKAASIACMERTAFSRFFKRTMGVTFSEFLRRWRVALAVEQMLNRDHSLAYIASAVGFKNLNSFGRTFRIVTGITPSEYKRRGLRLHRITLPVASRLRTSKPANRNQFPGD